jgi:hypothetical protein
MPADSCKHEQGRGYGFGQYLWHMRTMAGGRMLRIGSVMSAMLQPKPAKKLRPKAQ